jgi:hypothetical protein
MGAWRETIKRKKAVRFDTRLRTEQEIALRLFQTALLAAALVAPAAAQSMPTGRELDFNQLKRAVTVGRRDFVKEYMQGGLTPAYEKTFWEVYEKYDRDRGLLDDDTIRLLERFTKEYPNLTGDQLKSTLEESAKIRKRVDELRLRTFRELAKKTTPQLAARFHQIDDYLTTVNRMTVLQAVPLMGSKPQ